MVEPRLDSGPGKRPDLAWLPVDRLTVDRRYQRPIDSERSEKLIARIAAHFRWAMFQAIMVTPHPLVPKSWLIIDGQHRTEGAKRAGLVDVPAVIVEAASLEDQAQAFLGANQDRVAVNPYALYHVRVTAGEEQAGLVAKVCAAAKITIPRYPVPASNMKPGETIALGAIERLIRVHGIDLAQLAVGCVANAYREQPGGIRAAFIMSAAALLKDAPTGGASALAGRITDALSRTEWPETERLIAGRKARFGGTAYDNAAAIIRVRLPVPVSAYGDGFIKPIDRARLMAGR